MCLQAVQHIFDSATEQKDAWIYEVAASYVEIYCERIKDLLNPAQGTNKWQRGGERQKREGERERGGRERERCVWV
jgi:hypothetical protein